MRGQHPFQLTLAAAFERQYAVLQGMDRVPLPVELHAHRVDQKRRVQVEYLDHRMGGLPAVLLSVRIEHPELFARPVVLLQEAPERKRATQEVSIIPGKQLLQWYDAEELLAEPDNRVLLLRLDQFHQPLLQYTEEFFSTAGHDERHAASR